MSIVLPVVKAAVLSPKVAGVAAPVEIFRDNFTDTDGTNLTSHTPNTGGSWTLQTGVSPTIQSNKCSGTLSYEVVRDVGAATITITTVLNFGAANDIEVLFRNVDGSNYGLATLDAGGVVLYTNIGGAFTNVGAWSTTLTAGTDYAFKVVLNGATATVFVDGVQRASYASFPNPTNTKVGLRKNPGAVASTADNFVVTTP